MQRSTALSLYVHVPWCESKCPYCDFNSHALRGKLPERAYVDALLIDLDQHLPEVGHRPVNSIFMGGGTPSLLSPSAVATVLSGIRARLSWAPDIEVTLEANPSSSETHKFGAYRDAGVTRLSLGVQSFQDAQLARLGRIHTRQDALEAAQAARDSGFDNCNLDLMFGLPGQRIEHAIDDIETAIALRPTHLSCYQLTIEPHTPFHSQAPELPPDDDVWCMHRAIQLRLQQSGYAQYEVSAYAKDRRRSRHNMNYWRFGDYLGLGAGAHSKISYADRAIRFWKDKHPNDYLNHVATERRIAGRREVRGRELIFEFMLNALRLRDGFELPLFQRRTGQSIGRIIDMLDELKTAGLLYVDGSRINTTDRGYRFLDDVVERFLPSTSP